MLPFVLAIVTPISPWELKRVGETAMSRIVLLARQVPALLLAGYIFSFLVLPQELEQESLLDGSWRYSLGKFRELGFSLGSDSWFTYGPVAHWFGPPIGSEQFHPLPYYLTALVIACVTAISLLRILSSLDLGFRYRVAAVLLFPVTFIGMETSLDVHLFLALFLLLLSCCLRQSPDVASMVSLTVLSACGMLYKFSFGMLSLFTLALLLLSLFLGRRIEARALLCYCLGYLGALYGLFVALTGSGDLLTYLALGLETAGLYSQIMIKNKPFSPPLYLVGALFLAAGSVLAWQAAKKAPLRCGTLCLAGFYLGASLLLYKHGFVRADQGHMKLFYASVTPMLALLGLVAWAGFTAKGRGEKLLIGCSSLTVAAIYAIMLAILPGDTGAADLPGNWGSCGNRLAEGVKGQNPEEYAAKIASVRESLPLLFSRLNQHARSFESSGRKPRITFYPWELLLFEGVAGYDLAPSPSLQLYSSGPNSKVHRLEADFLSSERRPDVVVIGPDAIDSRSPVSELTTLLPPLYAHYQVIDVVDGYTILSANRSGKSPDAVIRHSETPQGAESEFLRISTHHAAPVNRLFWGLASTLFKAPELSVVVTMKYSNEETVEYTWRGYLGQLQDGVFFAPEGVAEFMASSFASAPNASLPKPRDSVTLQGASAQLRRNDGFWNLPVIPKSLPLKVSYCSYR